MIEVVIALAIMGILLVLGVPSLADWLQNTRIRTAAEDVQSGLQLARNEAVRRNANVEFRLTNIGTAGGTGWTVRIVTTDEAVQAKPNSEGSANVMLTTVPDGANTVTFNGFGRFPTTGNADGSPLLTQVDIDNPSMGSANSRELRILITNGGQIRMCDPNVTDATDPRLC